MNEVKGLGRATGSTRTPEQAFIARFWNALMIVEELEAAAADGLVAGFDCKYAYNFWPPYLAIVFADSDGNPATVADSAWTPLLNTPVNFQEYVSAHSAIPAGSSACWRIS